MLKFNKGYLFLTILLLIIEVIIALYVHDTIIRPYVGDILVVILIYCFFRSFLNLSVLQVATFTMLFAYFIETLQYFHLVNKFGIEHYKVAKIILGNTFAWVDILAYTFGILIVIGIEKFRFFKNK